MAACLYLFLPQEQICLNFSLTYVSSFQFQMEIKIVCHCGFHSQTTQILVISRCCFAEDG